MSVPSFNDVPDHWKHPIGPYRQAPTEFGGAWWLVNPFTSADPWVTQRNTEVAKQLPAGFVEIFGARPTPADFLHSSNPSLHYRIARDRWEQDLEHFKRAGTPEWMEDSQKANADQTHRAWGLGSPRYYEGRYGWMGRFTDSAISDFEAPAWSIIFGAHQLIASYQIRLIERGIVPEQRHPFVPPHVWPDSKESEGRAK